MSKSEFVLAVTQLAAERGLPKEKVIAAVEAALISAYKKESQAAGQDISVRLDPQTGDIRVYLLKKVVEVVTNPKQEIGLAEARRYRPTAAIDEVIELESPQASSGRIAAQTAKQVVLQRLREAERELVLAEFVNKVGDILPGRIERIEPMQVVVALGRAEAILPREEQVPTERYRAGQTLQFYLVEVQRTIKGPELILSRTHKNLLRRLMEREVPELHNGVVEIRAIAREPGSRSKVAVVARQEGVDPVGSCVGLRGIRIQNVVNELQGEKVDIFLWNKEVSALIANALSPAQVVKVDLDEKEKTALAVVPDKLLSLAIGREGQNARLAAKLTLWKIDIKSLTEYEALQEMRAQQAKAEEAVAVAVTEETVAKSTPALEIMEAPSSPAEEAAVAERVELAGSEEQQAVAATAAVAPEQTAPLSDGEAVPPTEEGPAAPEEAEAPGISVDSEEVWAVPKISEQPGVLRFAEEIMAGRAASQGRKDKKGREEPERVKPKRAKRARVVEQSEDEEIT
ncbi:MAG: transcription termination/antitermination protein NusA [Chloroflexi bacterium]|nr:transcription termination/antitermination protein NusA [Chloroflexota bacterium]